LSCSQFPTPSTSFGPGSARENGNDCISFIWYARSSLISESWLPKKGKPRQHHCCYLEARRLTEDRGPRDLAINHRGSEFGQDGLRVIRVVVGTSSIQLVPRKHLHRRSTSQERLSRDVTSRYPPQDPASPCPKRPR
jgi:hypothetical protein